MWHRSSLGWTLLLAVLATTVASICTPARGEEEGRQAGSLSHDGAAPENLVVKFFYFDGRRIEWVVSAEPDRLERHLEADPDSAQMFQSLKESVAAVPDTEQIRLQMAQWLESERERVTDPGSNVIRLRKAEGIVAYLRAHDLRIDELVRALLRRSGATTVELVAVHLVDRSGMSSFQLKVVLPDEQVGIGGQGFNVAFNSPQVTYTSVVYALALALDAVHEVINTDSEDDPAEGPPSGFDAEPLPPPLPLLSPTEEDIISRTRR